MRYIFTLTLLLICTVFTLPAQIIPSENGHFDADSIRREFDNGPYFTLFRDNYFVAGTTIGERITRENSDVKFQISIAQRLTKSTLPFHTYFFLFYTQKCFWNVFEESMPMRDLNFNPGLGLSKLLIVKNQVIGKASLMLEHESNGRDGTSSRSWNRITFSSAIYIDPQLQIFGKVWVPIVDGQNNRNIIDYCGIYTMGMTARSKNGRFAGTVILNKRGTRLNFNYNTTIELSYRLFRKENQSFFIQYYNGYGEGLLDYNKFHSRLRIGIVIKPPFFSDF